LHARALQSLGVVRTFVQSLNAIDDRHARLPRRPGFGGIAVAQFPPQRDRATRPALLVLRSCLLYATLERARAGRGSLSRDMTFDREIPTQV
jgi:hypothetical protein